MAKTILIVDDSASLRQLACIVLKRAGYEVIEACDGSDALAKLDGRKVHLIISDVNMPNMDGLTFVKHLKNMPEYKFMPIVMLSMDSYEISLQEARETGAKAWMVKPFTAEKLLDTVSRFVQP